MSDFFIADIRTPTKENPLRILFSACQLGRKCGWDGSSYDFNELVTKISVLPLVKQIPYCPEEYSFGAPREFCSIHGGNGYDVLDGNAKLLTVTGVDWTDGILKAADEALRLAKENQVDLAIMMDTSPSCGLRVIYRDDPAQKVYQAAPGVVAAHLKRNAVRILTNRDFRYLEMLLAKLDPSFSPHSTTRNHFEEEWYQTYFRKK